MSKTIVLTEGLDGFIRLSMGKGCYLKLRAADYYAAVAAGKAERRMQLQAARETHDQALRDAGRLAWIDEDAP